MSEIITEINGSIMSLWFNRPEKRNGINFDMFNHLTDSIIKAKNDDEIRVLHIGSKHDVFTAGADLGAAAKDIKKLGSSNPATMFVQRLRDFPKPVIASVPGMAIGLGTTMLFHCDFVFASSTATFRTPFASLALVPEAGSSFLLPRMAGHQMAAEMLLTAAAITAERAREMGFINAILEPEQLIAHSMEKCEEIAKLPPLAIRRSKELMRRPYREFLQSHMDMEREQFIEQLDTAEFREAWERVLSKR